MQRGASDTSSFNSTYNYAGYNSLTGDCEPRWVNQNVFPENDTIDSDSHKVMLAPQMYNRYLRHRERHVINGTETLYDIEEDDDYYTYDNNTYTTSVSIRVTPVENYLTSWGILFACFGIASCFAAYQLIYKEKMSKQQYTANINSVQRSRRARRRIGGKRPTIHPEADSSPDSHDRQTPVLSTTESKSLRPPPSDNFYYPASSTYHYEHNSAIDGDESTNVISSADETRSMFRRILLLAMISRMIMMPVMIWSNPQWYQFVGDTLPEMIFASAWTLLVTFFVQIVGIASGVGTNASPGIVIQATAYIVYLFLIGLQLVDTVATVLLYALLCCIYAALLGVVLYYFPTLIWLLQSTIRQSPPPPPSTSSDSNTIDNQGSIGALGLSVRLIVTMVASIFVFLARTVGYAILVVMPPRRVYWWWNYGVLELLPTCIFLLVMHPRTVKVDRDAIDPDLAVSSVMHEAQLFRGYRFSGTDGPGRMRRVDSSTLRRNEINPLMPAGITIVGTSIPLGTTSNDNTPSSSEGKQVAQETTALLKKSSDYGTTAGPSAVMTSGDPTVSPL